MTVENFIKKWLGNRNKQYTEQYRDEMRDDIYKLIERVNGRADPMPPDIRAEMDADMEDSGMAQGEIESCLNHWGNKYTLNHIFQNVRDHEGIAT